MSEVAVQQAEYEIEQEEKEAGATSNVIDSNPKRKRRLWPWLVLLAVTLLAIYGYRQADIAWEDMVRTWRDLVQLFWWIIPDQKS